MNKLINVTKQGMSVHGELMVVWEDTNERYEGYSLPGADVDEEQWMIKKITKNPGGNYKDIVSYAGDDKTYDKKWSKFKEYFGDAPAVSNLNASISHYGGSDVIFLKWDSVIEASFYRISVYTDAGLTEKYYYRNSIVPSVGIFEKKNTHILQFEKDIKKYYITVETVGVNNITISGEDYLSVPNVSSPVLTSIDI